MGERVMSKSGARVSVVFVEKCDAKSVKDALDREGCLEKGFRMISTADNLIAIPTKSNDDAWEESLLQVQKIVRVGEYECPYSTAKLGNGRLDLDSNLTHVQQGLWNWLHNDMGAKDKILSLDILVCPKKLELFGDDRTLIIPRQAFSLENEGFRLLVGDADIAELWRHLARIYHSPRVAKRGDINPNSPIRESGHELLWPIKDISSDTTTGPDAPGWITVTEQGIRQSLDMTRVMFSRGNITEKIRFGKIVQEGDVLLDMYAGIGYYTLPALIHGRASHVYACEWNTHAAFALEFNLKANGVDDRATVFVGDCRKSAKANSLVDVCDRVSLGLLPSSEGGWKTAVKALRRSSGGWLHVHGNVPEKEWKHWTLWLCKCLCSFAKEDLRSDWVALCTNVTRVKSFAPTVYHYVADVFVGPRIELIKRDIRIDMNESGAGMVVGDKFEPSPWEINKPSSALDPNGVLHQEWMMANDD